MALTLTVDRARWQAHVAEVRAAFPGLVPVVKGNGYGFGRTFLADTVEEWGSAGKTTAASHGSWPSAPCTSWPGWPRTGRGRSC